MVVRSFDFIFSPSKQKIHKPLMAKRPFPLQIFSHHRSLSLVSLSSNPPLSLLSRSSNPPLSILSPLSLRRRVSSSPATFLSRRHRPPPSPPPPAQRLSHETLAQKIGKSVRLAGAESKARVYSDVNVVRPKEYWDYESLAVQWG